MIFLNVGFDLFVLHIFFISSESSGEEDTAHCSEKGRL
jgi:hypothetical protein